MSAPPFWFDRIALYSALDNERTVRAVSWTEAARQIGVAPSTLKATARPGPMETDGMLAMVRWLGCSPETFIRTSTGDRVYDPGPDRSLGRFDVAKLHAALNERRIQRRMTWMDLVAEFGRGVSAPMLTRLSKGGRIGVHVMVLVVGWLGCAVGEFCAPGASTRVGASQGEGIRHPDESR